LYNALDGTTGKLPQNRATRRKTANKILDMYLKNAETIPMITDIVHAMGKAVGYVLGINGQKGQK